MGRDHFQFKQFLVRQKQSAMRVGTDGVLLGAWLPLDNEPQKILDVGTGTGLMALMLAQRCPEATIQGVETDLEACEEARANFAASKWSERLTAIHSTFQQYARSASVKYDLMVCNPPFFSDGIKSSCNKKRMARHNDSLSHEEILDGCKSLMTPVGRLGIILPAGIFSRFQITAARRGWFEHRRTWVRPLPHKPAKRVLSLWGLQMRGSLQVDEMTLEWAHHQYSPEFKALTAEFYLDSQD